MATRANHSHNALFVLFTSQPQIYQ